MALLRKPLTEFADFTRGSAGTLTGSDAARISVGNNVPRIDYDPAGNAIGLMIEKASSNLILHSNKLDEGVWTKTRASIHESSVIGATADETLWELRENDEDGAHILEQIVALGADALHCCALDVRPGAREAISIWFADTGWQTTGQTFFDLKNSTILSNANILAGIIPRANGVKRLFAIQRTAASGTKRIRIMPLSSISAPSATYLGDGVSSLYLSAIQLEIGSVPTSHIVTGATAVSRAADVLEIDEGTLFGNQGTFIIGAWPYSVGDDGQYRRFIELHKNDGAFTNRVLFDVNNLAAPAQHNSAIYNDNLLTHYHSFGNLSPTAQHVAIAYQNGDTYSYSGAGDAFSPVAVATVPDGLKHLNIGSGVTDAGNFNGHFQRLYYTNKVLPKAITRAMAGGLSA